MKSTVFVLLSSIFRDFNGTHSSNFVWKTCLMIIGRLANHVVLWLTLFNLISLHFSLCIGEAKIYNLISGVFLPENPYGILHLGMPLAGSHRATC